MKRRHIHLLSLCLAFSAATPSVAEIDASDWQIAQQVTLIDEKNSRRSISGYRGKYRLVFFGYTSCPDVCPVTLFEVASAIRVLGEQGKIVVVLFITVDPLRDTPGVLAEYTDAFHPDFVGLSASYDDLVKLTKGFRTTFGYSLWNDNKEVPVTREQYLNFAPDHDYTPYHSSQVYLLNPDDELVEVIGHGSDASHIADTLRLHIQIK